MELYLPVITAFVIAFFLVWRSIPVIVRLSKAKNLYDEPNERRVNKTVVPNLGGVALFIGISIATLLSIHKVAYPDLRYILASMIILFFVGIKDDILVISARKKLIAQLVSAVILIGPGGIRFTHLHGLFGINEIGYLFSFIISVLAIVAIINAVNLIDGIDGLAAAIGIIATTVFGTSFLLTDHFRTAVICFATTGSLLAFFFYNVFGRTNKIFMGDTGSLILGLLLAVFVVKYNEFTIASGGPVEVFAPVFSAAVISIPLFDMIRVFTLRLFQKKSPFSPDMNHIHHKLLKLGFTHLKSTMVIVLVNLFLIGFVFVFRSLDMHILLVLLLSLAVFLSLLPGYFLEIKKLRKLSPEKMQLLFFMPFKNFSKTGLELEGYGASQSGEKGKNQLPDNNPESHRLRN